MKYKIVITTSTMCLFLGMLGASAAYAQQYAIRSIDVPGAAATMTSDTNNHGEIVGCYTTVDFSSGTGIILANAAFSLVRYPKAIDTCANGVSNDGKVAGFYEDVSSNLHGFLLVGKTFTSLDYPGAVFTEATKVNKAGVVVGLYYDGTTDHGFRWQSGTFTTVDYPGASSTLANGINDAGVIVGGYVSDSFHGFTLSGSTYTTIDYPGADGTSLTGINNFGQIVGSYYNTPYLDQGFTDFNGVFSTVNYPGAAVSGITGINDEGQLVGLWGGISAVDDEDIHGFVATPIPGTTAAERNRAPRAKGLLAPR